MEKLGLEPAFSSISQCQNPEFFDTNIGISKRLYIATMAMQGILSSGMMHRENIAEICKIAYKYSDELLRQEYG